MAVDVDDMTTEVALKRLEALCEYHGLALDKAAAAYLCQCIEAAAVAFREVDRVAEHHDRNVQAIALGEHIRTMERLIDATPGTTTVKRNPGVALTVEEMAETLAATRAQLAVARTALEHYADKKHWAAGIDPMLDEPATADHFYIGGSIEDDADGWEVAAKALKDLDGPFHVMPPRKP